MMDTNRRQFRGAVLSTRRIIELVPFSNPNSKPSKLTPSEYAISIHLTVVDHVRLCVFRLVSRWVVLLPPHYHCFSFYYIYAHIRITFQASFERFIQFFKKSVFE